MKASKDDAETAVSHFLELEQLRLQYGCSREDLLDAISKLGNNPQVIKLFLSLNRKLDTKNKLTNKTAKTLKTKLGSTLKQC